MNREMAGKPRILVENLLILITAEALAAAIVYQNQADVLCIPQDTNQRLSVGKSCPVHGYQIFCKRFNRFCKVGQQELLSVIQIA